MSRKTLTVTVEFDSTTSRETLMNVLGELLYASDVVLSDPLDEDTGSERWDYYNIDAEWQLS